MKSGYDKAIIEYSKATDLLYKAKNAFEFAAAYEAYEAAGRLVTAYKAYEAANGAIT